MVRKSTWIIFAIFIAFLIIGILITWHTPESSNSASPTPVELALPADILAELSEICYKDSNGSLITIRQVDGSWSFTSDHQTEINQSRIGELISNLKSLEIFSKFNSSSNTNELELFPTGQEIILTNSKGKSARISIGSPTPTGSGYYLQVDNDVPVIVRKGAMETILDLLSRGNLIYSLTSSP
jgi:hypothetical protein